MYEISFTNTKLQRPMSRMTTLFFSEAIKSSCLPVILINLPSNRGISTFQWDSHFFPPLHSSSSDGWVIFCLYEVGQNVRFLSNLMGSKHQNDLHEEAGATDFLHLTLMFRVCRLFPAWYNVERPQLNCSLSTLTGLLDRGITSNKKCPARNLANHFWHAWSVTAFSPYTPQILFRVVVITFLPCPK